MIIAFCGPSGSGKSTLIREIKKISYFRNKEITIYREDNFLILKLAKKIFGDKIFREYNESKMSKEAENKENTLFSSLIEIIYPFAIFFEYLYLYFFYNVLFPDRILLSDRFIYDYIVTLKQNLKIKNRLAEVMFINFPRPSLLFYLDIDSETAFLRNKNAKKFSKTNSKSYQSMIVDEYRNIANMKNMVMINTKGRTTNALINIRKHINNKEILNKVKEIAIIGTDGSGKTTISNLLNNYCRSLSISSRVIHFFHENILLKLFRSAGILRERKPNKLILGKSRLNNRRKMHRSYFLKFLLSLLHVTDSYIQFIYYKFIHANSLLIFDRYFYDYLIGFKYYDIKGFDRLEKIIPEIKNTYLMKVDSKKAYERKPEAFLDFYSTANKTYLELATRKGFIVINGNNKNPEEIMQLIINNLKI